MFCALPSRSLTFYNYKEKKNKWIKTGKASQEPIDQDLSWFSFCFCYFVLFFKQISSPRKILKVGTWWIFEKLAVCLLVEKYICRMNGFLQWSVAPVCMLPYVLQCLFSERWSRDTSQASGKGTGKKNSNNSVFSKESSVTVIFLYIKIHLNFINLWVNSKSLFWLWRNLVLAN